ncbi:glycosyl transferase [Stenomitos frigidus ULC18]|uniref:4,4'-diaponeurosporenoate glycosyltransferase n=2 Tax=Stenomitos TaxID=1844270 RepID=A0A2T1E3P6_9CYAN|nr:glycosyl transferase [Stenomitos frigidus ULC18]
MVGLSARSLHSVRSHPLVQALPLPQCEVCVIVPVRNEAEHLGRMLTALRDQRDLAGSPLDPARYEVILLANNCSDHSAAIAHRFAVQHPSLVLHVVESTFSASKANIGWVRKLLMDEAFHRLNSLGRHKGIIASTDGDTQVAPDWIAATQHEIACGVDAVGGRIITDRGDRAALGSYVRACHLREVGYRCLVAELEAYLDPDPFDGLPRHFQHYGASLAVTAEMYQQAGGLPPVRTSEDVALYRALVRVNARFRHSPLVRVTTSARPIGRAQGGLANQLSAWAVRGEQQQPFLVEPAGAIAARLHARHALRSLWQRFCNGYPSTLQEMALPASWLEVDCDWLSDVFTQQASFGALFEQIEHQQAQEKRWQQRWPLVNIEQAIDDLRLLLEPLRRRQPSLQGKRKPLPKPVFKNQQVSRLCHTLSPKGR